MKKLLTLTLILFAALSYAQTSAGYSIGSTATDFELKNVDGNLVSLKGTFPDAKGYIVIFTCNHCPYAVLYEDRIKALNEKHSSNGYPVVAVNPNDPEIVPEDSFENMKERSEEKGFDFPYVFDEAQTIFPKYGALKTPHIFLLDAEMTVRYIGAIDDNPRNADAVTINYVDNAIAALEQGNDPEPAETKAIGCRIKVQ